MPNTQGAALTDSGAGNEEFIIFDKANNRDTVEFVPRSANRESALVKAKIDGQQNDETHKQATSPDYPMGN